MQRMREFIIGGQFLSRASLLELGFGIFVVNGLLALFASLSNSVITPLVGLILPDFSVFRIWNFQIGSVINELISISLRTAILYLVILFPLQRLTRRKKIEDEAPAFHV